MEVRDEYYFESSGKHAFVRVTIDSDDEIPVRLEFEDGWYSLNDIRALKALIAKAEKIAKTQQLP